MMNSFPFCFSLRCQLQQQASEDNPVFLPGDSEYDWQLAKLYVRNADCLEHQASFYLRTHLAETFTVSVMRNLPAAHPIHKVLKIRVVSMSM